MLEKVVAASEGVRARRCIIVAVVLLGSVGAGRGCLYRVFVLCDSQGDVSVGIHAGEGRDGVWTWMVNVRCTRTTRLGGSIHLYPFTCFRGAQESLL